MEDIKRKYGRKIKKRAQGIIIVNTRKRAQDQERKKSMKRCKITAVRKTEYKDLMEKYENPIQHACDIEEGQVFITEGWKRPEGFCESAWESISPFVMTLAYGGSDIYEGWMKNKNSAMISCNDGFRPVSFYIEVLDEIY